MEAGDASGILLENGDTVESAIEGISGSIHTITTRLTISTATEKSEGFFIITDIPDELPDIFAVRFKALADYVQGDRIRIGEKDIAFVTLSLKPLPDKAFLKDTLVSLDVDYIGGRAFLN